MTVLIILNHDPYDGSDITWNALRLCGTLLNKTVGVKLFLMNDAVDLARDETVKPDTYDHDLVAMLKDLHLRGMSLKVCGTCMARCGIHRNRPYFSENIGGTMNDLAEWIVESDKVLTF